MGDKKRGLYGKFHIARVDGTDAAGKKHDGCEYFVLDITHDPHAIRALHAYAASCHREYPLLAEDLYAILKRKRKSEWPTGEGGGDE